MHKDKKILAIIPARAGSKRIPRKNIRLFHGKPLIAYTIEQALACPMIDRVIVDTDSNEIKTVAEKYGAEVPFLRPPKLARDNSKVVDSIIYMLNRLREEQHYMPTYLMILQTTSPLREKEDIEKCWNVMQEGGATTVLTVCPTHPRLYHVKPNKDAVLVNGFEGRSTNMQAWPEAYILNGCFVYIVKTNALLKERRIITKKTKAVICPKWRSIDLDHPEDWVMAEFLYKNKDKIHAELEKF